MCVEGAWVGVGISIECRRCGLGRCAGMGEDYGRGCCAEQYLRAVSKSRT